MAKCILAGKVVDQRWNFRGASEPGFVHWQWSRSVRPVYGSGNTGFCGIRPCDSAFPMLAGGDAILDSGLADVPRVFSTSASAFHCRSCSTAISSTLRRAGTAGSSSTLHPAPTEKKVLLLQWMFDSHIAHCPAHRRDCRCGLVQISATTFSR